MNTFHSARTSTSDYVVIGSGINSLVAAAELARAGASVTLLEERDRLGGFIDSGELTEPGFIHDTFSSWHPLFMAGAAYAELGQELHRHGLRYLNTEDAGTPWVCGSVGTDAKGRVATVLAQRDPVATAHAFEYAADREAYAVMLHEFGAQAPVIFGAMGSEMNLPNVAKLGFKALRMGFTKLQGLLRQGLMSGRNLTRSRFVGDEVDQLWAPWLLHAGLGPDQVSGGVMLPVMAASMHQFGLPIVAGGARGFVAAFESLLRENSVTIHTGVRADSILTRDGRAAAVITASGTFEASRGILASVSVPQIYDELLAGPEIPHRIRTLAGHYQPGRAAMQIHVALDAPVPWSDERLAQTPLIHLSTGSNSTAIACAQAESGLLPANPTIVIGQQCVLDPSRAPAGKATLWLQLQELPFEPVGDAAHELDTSGGWNEKLVAAYVQRVLSQIEHYAPGLRELVLGIKAISPRELSEVNRNAVGGDPYGGSAELFQNLLWRPLPQLGKGRSPVKGLWHIGAATHPGPGLGGGSGHLTAQQLIHRSKSPLRQKSST
ncbi:NAD(P)/FAD-dependent oxidoreductase [Arthrobacter sp. GMC3]|uniref:phytoene desaturase family protein n=1 Tax=Arthrobacter sp. GMC3 TaxID=2058894 RepID=UPI000CE474D1|nr:NAD(P)/FAD-dependent oxidoreductase [Arthrobacter sp. GMC3]